MGVRGRCMLTELDRVALTEHVAVLDVVHVTEDVLAAIIRLDEPKPTV